MDIKNHKNLTIKSKHSFKDLPLWFQEASTENAIVTFDIPLLHWHGGAWKGGEVRGMHCLINGQWRKSTPEKLQKLMAMVYGKED